MADNNPKEAVGTQRDIANLLERQLTILAQIGKAYDAQVGKLSSISKLLAGLPADELNKKLGDTAGTTAKLTDLLKDVGDKSETNLGRLISGAGKAKKGLAGMGTAGVIAASALSGLWKGLKNVWNTGKALITVAGGIAESLYNVGAAIVSVPLQLYQSLIDMSNKFKDIMLEVARQVEAVRKEFGTFKGPVSGAVLYVDKTMKGFKATGLSTYRVFGNIAERMEFVRENATAMGASLGVLTEQFKKDGGAWFGFEKGLGLAGEEMKSVADYSISTGKTVDRTFRDMTKQSLELGDAFKLDAKLISRDMGRALKDVTHFAGATIKQIGQASTYARKLGLELDKITGTLDAFETFDTAAENAAKLSQSFGLTVDAFKLMEAQSPDEQIDMIKKSMIAAGKSTDNMDRQSLKLLATTVHLDEATAKQAFSQKNLGVSLEDIKKKGDKAEHKTLSQAEAMKKLADSIERMVKGQPEFKGFMDAFLKGFGRGVFVGGNFFKLMTNIRQSLLIAWREGYKFGKVFVDIFPGVRKFIDGLQEFFQPRNFKKIFSALTTELTKLIKGETSIVGLFATLKEALPKELNEGIDAMIQGAKQFTLKLSSMFADALKSFIPFLTESIQGLVELITHPEKVFATAGGAKGAMTSFASQLFAPIKEVILNPKIMMPFFDAIEKLLEVVWEKIKNSEAVHTAVKYAMLYIGAQVLVPTLTSIIGGIVTQKLIGSAITSLLSSGAVSGAAAAGGTGIMASLASAASAAAGLFGTAISGVIAALPVVVAGAVGLFVGWLVDTIVEKVTGAGLSDRLGKALTDWDLLGYAKEEQDKADKSMIEHQKKLAAAKKRWADEAAAARAKSAAANKENALTNLQTNFAKDPQRYVGDMKTMVTDIEETKRRLEKLDIKAVATSFSKINELSSAVKPFDEAMLKKLELTGNALTALGAIRLDGLLATTKKVQAGALVPALDAVKKMITVANELDEALSDDKLNKFNVTAKLKNVAEAVGLGAKANYTVKNKDVAVTLNLTVTMNAGDVEKVILQRKESVIRDRLINAQYNGSSNVTAIPNNPNSPSPAPIGPVK